MRGDWAGAAALVQAGGSLTVPGGRADDHGLVVVHPAQDGFLPGVEAEAVAELGQRRQAVPMRGGGGGIRGELGEMRGGIRGN